MTAPKSVGQADRFTAHARGAWFEGRSGRERAAAYQKLASVEENVVLDASPRLVRRAARPTRGTSATLCRPSSVAGAASAPKRPSRNPSRAWPKPPPGTPPADPRARVAGRDDAQRGASGPTSRCSSCLAACGAHQACLARRRAAPALGWRSQSMKRGSVGAAGRTMGIGFFLVSNLGQPPRGRAIIPRASPWPARPTTRARASNRDREPVLFAGHGLRGPYRSWDTMR
jgi:hypothetical protein